MPERGAGCEPLNAEVLDPKDDEIETYTQGAQNRIKGLTRTRHGERKANEAL